MTTSPDDPGPVPEEPESDRAAAEQLYAFACQAVEGLYDTATADQLAARSATERLAEAQMLVLQAIYRELRHGHDQVRLQVDALAAHTQALGEHADEMDNLGKALLFEGDVRSRRR